MDTLFASLLAQLEVTPADDLLRAVAADRLEELGDDRHHLLRAPPISECRFTPLQSGGETRDVPVAAYRATLPDVRRVQSLRVFSTGAVAISLRVRRLSDGVLTEVVTKTDPRGRVEDIRLPPGGLATTSGIELAGVWPNPGAEASLVVSGTVALQGEPELWWFSVRLSCPVWAWRQRLESGFRSQPQVGEWSVVGGATSRS